MATTDGGRSWHSQTTPLGSTSSVLYSISCPGTRVCYSVGEKEPGVGGSVIVATNNGGDSWHSQDSYTDAALISISCPGVAVCYAVGNNEAVVGNEHGSDSQHGTIVATTDAGVTWSRQLGTTGYFSAIACPDILTCYAVSGDVLWSTTDGGISWWQGERSNAHGGLTALACPAVSTCYAVGEKGTMIATTDGGRSWRSPAKA